jgi:hypothetical protein
MTPTTDTMPRKPAPAPPADLGTIYRLADHLDATLAMAEDLLRQSVEVAPLAAGDANAAITQRHHAIADFARITRALELGMTARILQARARAIEVRDVHPRFAPVIGLFVGGTAALADAAAGLDGGLGDVSRTALASGPQVLQFLATRGLVDADLPSLATVLKIIATEDYLVAERIQLGALMDMLARFLETLDLAFDLYAEPRAAE